MKLILNPRLYILICWCALLFCHACFQNSPTVKDLVVSPGFAADLIAAAPLIRDPVAAVYGPDLALWVVEMNGYMPDADGKGEDMPSGRIMRLFDKNRDGIMDSSQVFLDSLVLPRAVCPVGNGVLVAVPPTLFYYENKNGIAGKTIIVDSLYAEGGNVEHQANGLLRGMDNWIYNAKSDKRYRYRNDRWVSEKTVFRGQWGISMDNYGRLYYNNNSTLLQADALPPGAMRSALNHPELNASWFGRVIGNSEVFPIVPTPGINRGYEKDMLRKDSTLASATAACGLHIYRGDQFPVPFYGNALIPEPAGFLVARKKLSQDDQLNITEDHTSSPDDKTFMASGSEYFRPVNIAPAPDGTITLVDFHRGVIQHTTYMTPYLRQQIKARKLEKPIGGGRLYRIRHLDRPLPEIYRLDTLPTTSLVQLLRHKNGWHRDQAQQLIVDRGDFAAIPYLEKLLSEPDSIAALHALWTLEGLEKLTITHIRLMLQSHHHPWWRLSAMHLLEGFTGTGNATAAMECLLTLRDKDQPLLEDQFAAILTVFENTPERPVFKHLLPLLRESATDTLRFKIVRAALQNKTGVMLKACQSDPVLMKTVFISLLKEGNSNGNMDTYPAGFTKVQQESWSAGKSNFDNYCASCHGKNGAGMDQLAPPLSGSEWVMHPDAGVPIRILLDGLTGPVKVNGKQYQYPLMPGLRHNITANDGTVSNILTYIRNSWGYQAPPVSVREVAAIRKMTENRTTPYTVAELIR